MHELTSWTIWAVEIFVEAFTLLGLIVLMKVNLLL